MEDAMTSTRNKQPTVTDAIPLYRPLTEYVHEKWFKITCIETK